VSTRSQLVLALVSIVVVTIFFIGVVVKLGSANSLKPFNPSPAADGWSGIFFGMLYGVLLFVGFETAANLAEETLNPRREIPIAAMTTAGIATVFYVLATYVEVAGVPLQPQGDHRRGGGAAFRARRADPRWRVRRHLDRPAAGARGAVRHAGGRYRLRSGVLPRHFRDGPRPPAARAAGRHLQAERGAAWRGGLRGRCGNRHPADQPVLDRPVRPAGYPHYFALFAWGSTFGGFALVVVYLLMSVGSLRSFARSSRRVSIIVSAVIGILVTAAAIFGSFYKVTSPTIWAPWLALALLVVGFASTFVLRARQSASSQLTDLSEGTRV
jgi:amino acid transporter